MRNGHRIVEIGFRKNVIRTRVSVHAPLPFRPTGRPAAFPPPECTQILSLVYRRETGGPATGCFLIVRNYFLWIRKRGESEPAGGVFRISSKKSLGDLPLSQKGPAGALPGIMGYRERLSPLP